MLRAELRCVEAVQLDLRISLDPIQDGLRLDLRSGHLRTVPIEPAIFDCFTAENDQLEQLAEVLKPFKDTKPEIDDLFLVFSGRFLLFSSRCSRLLTGHVHIFHAQVRLLNEVAKDALESYHQQGPIHEVHSPGKENSLGPLELLCCRGEHL